MNLSFDNSANMNRPRKSQQNGERSLVLKMDGKEVSEER
jgi:hypothetical protein